MSSCPLRSRPRVSNRGRNSQFNLGTGGRSAPDCQSSASAFGAFAHPRETPVALPSSGCDDSLVHPDPIVAHTQDEVFASERQLDLDLARGGVLYGVPHRLPSD
jgi:hypothetical protein